MRAAHESAFEQFVAARSDDLMRLAVLLAADRGHAEDLVQTALAKTYANWRRVRSLDAAPGYARTTMVNTAASWFRKKGWRNERPTEFLPDRGHESDPSDRPAMVDALSALPPRQRAVIVLRYYEDLSVGQVASALGITEGTVKSQTSDALTRLRVVFGDAVVPQGATRD